MATHRVIADALNLREEPKPTGAIVAILPKGEDVTTESISGDGYWHKVTRANGESGWCAHKYLEDMAHDDAADDEEFPWMAIATRELGVKEYAGAADNPRIVEYLQSTTLGSPGNVPDSTHWCSAFVNWCMERAGYAGTDSAWARSWATWGRATTRPPRGCVVVFKRKCSVEDTKKNCGHVAFFVKQTATHVTVLGGNQSNCVCEARYPRADVLSYRLPR